MLAATVCGSFRRAFREIRWAIEELRDLGVAVLSPNPNELRITGFIDDFLLLSGDPARFGFLPDGDVVKTVEQAHLNALAKSHFMWLVCPDGELGTSSAFELGAAICWRVPVYSTTSFLDDGDGPVGPREYVVRVPSVERAIQRQAAIQAVLMGGPK